MSTVRANTYLDASGGSNAQLFGVASPPNSMGFRNRIINGDMRIDQRNAGAAVAFPSSAGAGAYTLDRFSSYRITAGSYNIQRSSVAPAGFSNSLLFTVTSTDTSVASTDVVDLLQVIEGFNIADLAWGSASAVPVTVSFWVRSSITGTFCCAVRNQATNRAYVREYTVSAANTWQFVQLTIPGDTSGTWATDNTSGILLNWSLMAGSSFQTTPNTWAAGNLFATSNQTNLLATNGATWQITGVQLEAGSVATPFERRDYGRELMMCQRYCEKSSDDGGSPTLNSGLVGWTSVGSNSYPRLRFQFKVNKRATPTVTFYDGAGTAGQVSTWNNGTVTNGAVSNVQLNTTEASAERQDATVLASRSFVYGAYLATAEL